MLCIWNKDVFLDRGEGEGDRLILDLYCYYNFYTLQIQIIYQAERLYHCFHSEIKMKHIHYFTWLSLFKLNSNRTKTFGLFSNRPPPLKTRPETFLIWTLVWVYRAARIATRHGHQSILIAVKQFIAARNHTRTYDVSDQTVWKTELCSLARSLSFCRSIVK